MADTSVFTRVFKKLSIAYHINYYQRKTKVTLAQQMKLQLVSCDVIGTKDAEYMQLEKVFNEFTKLVDVLAQDARIFRDSIAGKTRF